MKIKSLIIAAAMLASTGAHAEFLDRVDLGSAVVSGFASYHIDTKKHYNQDNLGLGYRFAATSVIVGFYHNSNYKTSVYAAYEARWKLTENVQAGLLAGGVTGYKRATVAPLLLPELALKVGHVELAVTYVPPVTKNIPQLVAAQARWAW